jgi:phosphoserine phosphatase RsbU/P
VLTFIQFVQFSAHHSASSMRAPTGMSPRPCERTILPGLICRNFFHFGESDLAHDAEKVMTKHSPNVAPQEFKDIVQLACLEVWGGNRRVNHSVELPGLAGWIYSDPVATAELGGDVHYISVCSKGIISRFALADVSGHGRSSSVMAQLLRKLINKHINTWDQSELMRELSESLLNTKRNGEQYATATLFAYCRPTRELVFTNAGHPAALWYHAKTDTWDWLEATTPFARPVEEVPLGLIPGTDYVQVAVQLNRNDVLVVYTDGITEASDTQGNMLGADGLMEIVRNVPVDSPACMAERLLAALQHFRTSALRTDDQSFFILRQLEG